MTDELQHLESEYKTDLLKGESAVPSPPPEGMYYCIPANTRREAAENFDKGVYLHISPTNATTEDNAHR